LLEGDGISGVVAPGGRLRDPSVSAGVAQLVEQLIRNQQVIGSSPIAGSIQNKSLTTVRAFHVDIVGCVWVAGWYRVESIDRRTIRARDQVPVDVDGDLIELWPSCCCTYANDSPC
jgi:hypothetical protein